MKHNRPTLFRVPFSTSSTVSGDSAPSHSDARQINGVNGMTFQPFRPRKVIVTFRRIGSLILQTSNLCDSLDTPNEQAQGENKGPTAIKKELVAF